MNGAAGSSIADRSAQAPTPPAEPDWRPRRRLRLTDGMRAALPLIAAIIVIGAIATNGSSKFLTTQNLQNLLEQISVLGVLSVGATFLMVAGQLDLSVGSGATLITIIFAKLVTGGTPQGLAILLCIGAGLAIGLIIGAIVASTRVAPFILTLGMMSVLISVALIMSNQQPISVGLRLSSLAVDRWLGIPLSFWVFLGALVAGALLLRYTRLGRNAYAAGSNEEAAHVSGVAVGMVKVGAHVRLQRGHGRRRRPAAGQPAGRRPAMTYGEAQAWSCRRSPPSSSAAPRPAGGRGTMLGTFLGVLLGLISTA
ncbi:MAG: ABC transporter permease [Solirubrobacteraceae bacterium]